LMVAEPTVALKFVRLTVAPVDVVPIAMNAAVWPTPDNAWVFGTIANETSGSGVGVTVKVAVPVTTVPSGFLACAVMATVPELTAVAIPVPGLMDAIALLLDPQTAGLIVAAPTVAD